MKSGLSKAVSVGVLLIAALCASDREDLWRNHLNHLAESSVTERLPGSEGHRKAAAYIAAELAKAGVRSGQNGYFQQVRFRSRRILEQFSSLALVHAGSARPLTLGEEAIVSMSVDPAPTVEAPLVFVGYGLSVPELHYDDLEGLELHGKIAVILEGGPSNIPAPLRARCQSIEERHRLLRQRAGVFGIVTIRNPAKTDIPWARESSTRLDAVTSPADPAFEQDDELELAVAFNSESAEKLFEGSGHTLKELLVIADAGRQLPRFTLPTALRARVAVERSEGESQNVVGMLLGSDPILNREYVVLTANMYNSSASASLLDLAEMLHASGTKLRRSILFIFLTGEDNGSLGSEFFAQYPPVNAANIVAELKVDMSPPASSLRAIAVYGLNESDLGGQARAAGVHKRMRIQADPVPQWNIPVRRDQYSVIRRGVPAVAFKPDYAGARDRSDGGRIHSLDLAEATTAAFRFDDVVFEMIKTVANRATRPQWLASSVFAMFNR